MPIEPSSLYCLVCHVLHGVVVLFSGLKLIGTDGISAQLEKQYVAIVSA